MHNQSMWKTIAGVLVICLAFSLTGAGEVLAEWDDQSDQLPGMEDDSVNTILIIGAVVVVGLVIYMIAKKSSKSDTEEGEDVSSAGGGSSSATDPVIMTTNVYGVRSPEAAVGYQLPVDPVVYLKKDGVGVGLGFAF